MIVIELIYNLSLLVSLSVISGFISTKFDNSKLRLKLLQGILFGIACVIGMLYPFVLSEGIIFDGRSVVISLCTLFFGPISGIIAAVFAIGARIYIGGGGIIMGIFVIVSSFLLGWLFNKTRMKSKEKILTNFQFYLFGLLVHSAMLLLIFTLPSHSILNAYKTIGLTVIGVYPLITVLIGKILQDQEKLLYEKRKFLNVIEATQVGTWIWNIQSGELEINNRWAEICGYTIEELKPVTTNTWENLVHPEDLKNSNLKLQNHFEGKTGFYELEARLKHKNGSWIWVLDKGKVIERDADGKPLWMFGTHQDITEKMKLIEELINSKVNAVKANQVKDAFIANISHEIRTPLSGILGMNNLIKEAFEESLSSRTEEFFNGVEEASRRITRTIDMIMNYSRIQTGEFSINNRNINLIEVINNLINEFQIAAKAKALNFSFECDTGEAIIFADEYCVISAIAELIDNAIKYTSNGFVKLSCSKNSDSDIVLIIEDSGIGISEEFMQNIFKPYTQEEMGYGRSFDGVGLGLSLVKELLELNSITITAKSEKNIGSKFILKFDKKICANNPAKNEKVTEISLGSENSKPAHSILIVEDDDLNQTIIQRFINKKFNTYCADSADDAYKVLIEKDIDLILMDISIRGNKNGLDFTSELKKSDKFSKIPIIALTAHTLNNNRQDAKNSGCDDFIAKPFTRDILLDTIENNLKKFSNARISG